MSTLPEEVFEQLERLAAAAPFEAVDIWIIRKPEGAISFTAVLGGNESLGLQASYGNGKTPAEAVDDTVKCGGSRDPNVTRLKKIAELEMQIAKLRMLPHMLPPWKPIQGLAYHAPEPAPEPPAFVNIESTTETLSP